MDSMLKPKPADDPHDIVVVAPDAVRVAPADQEISGPVPDAVRAPSEPQFHVGPDFSAGATVPPVDTIFRATAVNDALAAAGRRSLGQRALRAVGALLLAACVGGVAMAWHYHADATQRIIAEWAPLFARKSSQSPEKTALAAPPVLVAAEIDAANALPAQPAPSAAETVASADQTQSLETMARDLASANQEIAQLKASVEQLKTSQQQLVAMVSEKAAAQNLRPKKPAQSALPAPRPRSLRPAAAPIPPSTAAAPLPLAAAPYVPRPVEPPSQATSATLNDPELGSMPRPPMPLR